MMTRALAFWPASYAIGSIEFSARGDMLAVSCRDKVFVFDTVGARLRWTLVHQSGEIGALAFSSDGTTLACASSLGAVHVWDTRVGMQWGALVGHHGPVLDVGFTNDGRRLVSFGRDGSAIIWKALPTRG